MKTPSPTTQSRETETAPPSFTSGAGRGRPRWLWDVWLILVFVSFGPAMTLINNVESPNPATAALVALAILVVALITRLVLIRIGLAARGVTYAVALIAFAFLNAGSLTATFPLGRLGVIAVSVAAAGVIYGLRRLTIVDFAFSWACLGLALGAVVIAVQNLELGTADPVEIGDDFSVSSFVAHPDVVLIVADGYASNQVLSETYGFDNQPFSEALTAMGASVNYGMRSNYARTKLSVPSLLQMGYVTEGVPVTNKLESDLVGMLGGENRLAEMMRDNGYRTVYMESGWLGTSCWEGNDICIPNLWPDETFYDIVNRSVLRDFPGLEIGMSFARGARHVLTTLHSTLDAHLDDDRPDFVYIHLLAPHPPLFLDESCRMRSDPSLAGFMVAAPGMDDSQLRKRRDAYVAQVECVNTHLLRALEGIVDAGAVALILSDHGPDQGLQMFQPSRGWSDEQTEERLGIMFAAHHPGCDYQSLATLVNVGRRLLSCLSNTSVPILPDRYFDLDRHHGQSTIAKLKPPGSVG